MKSWIVHYKNKYPGANVIATESTLDVYQNGEHKVSMIKDGNNDWHCQSAERGCVDAHDLAPLPRDSRVHKIVDVKKGSDKQGRESFVKGIGLDEEAESRLKAHEEFLCENGEKVLSIAELKKKGYDFCDKGRVTNRPAKDVAKLSKGSEA